MQEESDQYKAFILAYDTDDWERAKELLEDIIEEEGHTAWTMTCMSSIEYEMRNYDLALNWSKKARKEAPHSPRVLWDMAGVLYMLERMTEAIQIWNYIKKLGISGIIENETVISPSEKYSSRMTNDCDYRLAQAFYYLDEYRNALDCLNSYISNLDKGVSTFYSRDEANDLLDKILDEM